MEGQSMSAVTRRSFLYTTGATAAAGVTLLGPAAARAATASTASAPLNARTAGGIYVAAGQTYTVSATTRVPDVTIEAGGALTAPSGYSLTMTVNGVEAGQRLVATSAADTAFVPGRWSGDIVLTVTTADDVAWQQHVYPFRQAICVDAGGLVPAQSVLAAAVGGRVGNSGANGVTITSTGDCFDGVVVNGGSYQLDGAAITLDGAGRCDFVGYGAAIVANGTGTRLVVDGAVVRNHGIVRTAAIADNGATLVVKNSELSVRNGPLPSGYIPTVNLDTMEDAPWMLGLNGAGDVRATNLLGNNSVAAYVNTSITSQSWGALSTDSGSDCTLVAVNSVVTNTGDSGYGTYAIGNATEYLLGTEFNVGSYATIFTGGNATYGDSDPAAVAALNASLGLGLTEAELRAIPSRPTVVNSRQWGFMWHADDNNLAITGGTVVNSPHATFLNKGQQIVVTVDGGNGARLNPGDGVIVQVIDNDDPGPVMVDGVLENAGVYTQPTGEPTKVTTFDVTVAHATDSVLSFTDISLNGDFYNGLRGGPASGGGPGGGPAVGLNLVLNFASSQVAGVITATLAEHYADTIDSSNWWELGHVSNTAQAVINNGVIVALTDGSAWTVAGTSYLSALSLDATSRVAGPRGRKVAMTVDGTPTAITAGASYAGAIVLTVA
jgi:hypothetical protein